MPALRGSVSSRARATLPEHERLEERIAREAVRAMDARARDLSDRHEPREIGSPVHVDPDPAAHIVRGGHDGDRLTRYVDPERETILVDVREALLEPLAALMRDIEKHVLVAALLHLPVDRPGDDVARRELAPRIVAFHERFAVQIPENRPFPAQRLGDEKRFRLGMIEARGMKLHELEIRDPRSRAVRHRDSVPRRHVGIRRIEVDLPRASRREHGMARENRDDAIREPIERIAAENPPPGIDDEIDRETVLSGRDASIRANRIEQRRFELAPDDVAAMHDPRRRMPPFAGERERIAALGLAEAHAEIHEIPDPVRPLADHDLDRFALAEPLPRLERIGHVPFERVLLERHGRDPALRVVRVALGDLLLRHDEHVGETRRLEGEEESGRPAPQHENIGFQNLQENLPANG